MRTCRTGAVVLGFVALALALRIAAAEAMIRHYRIALPDSELYLAYAQTLYLHEPYQIGGDKAQRAPGYPLFIDLCWQIAGRSERGILWAQAFVSTLTCLGIYRLVERWSTRHDVPKLVAPAALFIVAIEPYSIVASALVLSETVFTALMVATALAIAGSEDWSDGRAALGGVSAGLAVLVRPSGLGLAIGAGLAWLVPLFRHQRARHFAIAALAMLACLAPWWLRNARVYGTFVPTTLNVGASLYDGLNPTATGASDMAFAQAPEVRRMSELERDRYWRDRALAWAGAHPGQSARLAGRKLLRFWSPWPNEPAFRSAKVVAVTTIASLALWITAAVGAWRYRHCRELLAVCLGPTVYFCLVHLIFVSSVRYRIVGLPLVGILSAAGSVWLIEKRKQRTKTALA